MKRKFIHNIILVVSTFLFSVLLVGCNNSKSSMEAHNAILTVLQDYEIELEQFSETESKVLEAFNTYASKVTATQNDQEAIPLLNNLINELFEISNKTNYQEIKESISVYINLVRQLINMIALSNQEVVQILAQIENQEEFIMTALQATLIGIIDSTSESLSLINLNRQADYKELVNTFQKILNSWKSAVLNNYPHGNLLQSANETYRNDYEKAVKDLVKIFNEKGLILEDVTSNNFKKNIVEYLEKLKLYHWILVTFCINTLISSILIFFLSRKMENPEEVKKHIKPKMSLHLIVVIFTGLIINPVVHILFGKEIVFYTYNAFFAFHLFAVFINCYCVVWVVYTSYKYRISTSINKDGTVVDSIAWLLAMHLFFYIFFIGYLVRFFGRINSKGDQLYQAALSNYTSDHESFEYKNEKDEIESDTEGYFEENQNTIRCKCNHCSQTFEFNYTEIGQRIDCNNCGMETELYEPQLNIPKSKSVALAFSKNDPDPEMALGDVNDEPSNDEKVNQKKDDSESLMETQKPKPETKEDKELVPMENTDAQVGIQHTEKESAKINPIKHGKIIDISMQQSNGVISGDDGNRYYFKFSEWKSNETPQITDRVEFLSDGKDAKEVYQSFNNKNISSGLTKRFVAGMFAIFLGVFGVHKFYLGYSKQGIIILLCSIVLGITFIVPALFTLLGIIEGIIYLTNSDEEFENKYINNFKPWF